MNFLAKLLIKLSGWKYESKIDTSVTHAVAIFAPHTSNWDFFYSILILRIIGFPLKIMMKKSFFVFPLSILLKRLGVVPVDRSKNTNFVKETARVMKLYTSFYIGIAPEGTRSRVNCWKTGFYYLALEANVPIIMGYLDYKNK